jgi:uncharacterized FlaG/YvyC family protein
MISIQQWLSVFGRFLRRVTDEPRPQTRHRVSSEVLGSLPLHEAVAGLEATSAMQARIEMPRPDDAAGIDRKQKPATENVATANGEEMKMSGLTEKQAARYCQRTLESAVNRLNEQCKKYGDDFPYIESLLDGATNALHTAIDEMKEVVRES